MLVVLMAAVLAQESTQSLVNPFTSEADVARGANTFKLQCASCHGADGRGGAQGPDLSTGQFRRANSDEALFQIINKGIPGTTMPAFLLNPGPAWQVVAFIRSLSLNKRSGVKGDLANGQKLYGELGCVKCHESGNAPELGGIGSKRTVAELRESILEPQADVPSAAWRATVKLRDGKSVTGHRLNEDTFTIQLREAGTGALRSFEKAAVAGVTIDRRSPMPAYKDRLTGQALDDVLAYLLAQGAR